MIISGANLEGMEGSFKKLTDYVPEDVPFYGYLEYIQNLYYECLEKSKDISLNRFPIDGNKVVIEPLTCNHRCHADIETLRSISEYGVLATEWFGIAESEHEGLFCTFIDRIKPESYPSYKTENLHRTSDSTQEVVLFFDENEVMKKLLHYDLFEYERVKLHEPEKLKDKYTEEEIWLLDFLYQVSPAGFDFHDSSDRPYYYWSAIPGGIPSNLINGICIKLDEYSDEYLDEVNNLFPNATLFDCSLNVLRMPKKIGEDKHIK